MMRAHILTGKRTMNNAMMRAHNGLCLLACRDVPGDIVYCVKLMTFARSKKTVLLLARSKCAGFNFKDKLTCSHLPSSSSYLSCHICLLPCHPLPLLCVSVSPFYPSPFFRLPLRVCLAFSSRLSPHHLYLVYGLSSSDTHHHHHHHLVVA